MPYTIANPPEAIKSLPKHAQEIFIAAYNSAYEQYKGDEERTNATAWAAVKTKYEKKGDQWIANESASLQAKHANLIQESARHSIDISKTVELASKALAGDGDVSEAIKEVDSTMVILKEAAVVKTEDGVKYPADAFAFVPDKDKPSTWQLRIREGDKITKAMLNRAASFLSPGGHAGKRVEIPLEEAPTVKRTIRSAYKALGVPDTEISKWVKEDEVRDIIAEYTPLAEAVVTGKGKANVVVLAPGFNTSKGRYYDPEALKRDFGVFEGAKMFADHPTEADEKARPERSIRDWVATLKNVKVNEKGQIVGEAVVVEPWMQEKLATLRDKGLLNEMGISINAVGQATKQTIEGVKTNFIEKLVRARSVDFVTFPGAGGQVQMFESGVENDIDIISIEALRERRPDLVEQITTEVESKLKSEVKTKMELTEQVKALETDKATLLKENGELKAAIETEKQAKVKAEAQAAIKEAVVKAELPEPAKARLLVQFAEATDIKGLEEAIKSEKAYISSLAEAGKVKNMGKTQPDAEAGKKALRESTKRLHPEYTDKQLDDFVAGR